jgi:hypothetical protein
MKNVSDLSAERKFYWILFVLLWLYVWLRAFFTQMTHDETANFFRFVHTGNFLPYGLDSSATNHLLNSFLAWFFYSLFGAEPWVLRLGNVLFFPLFFYYLVKIASLLESKFLRIGFVVVLAFTHNLIEFFAMSRGYGHSMALLLGALWFLMQSFKSPNFKNYTLSLLFATLALSANLTLLNSVLLIIFFLTLRIVVSVKRTSKRPWKNLIPIFIIGIAPVVFFVKYLFHLKAKGDLYYGEQSGFWEITVKSLNKTMLDPGYGVVEIFIGLYLIFILTAGVYLFFRKFKVSRLFESRLLFFYFLTGNAVAVFLMNKLLGINYPEDRTGLYFVVYFFGSIFFLVDYLAESGKLKWIIFFTVPLVFVPVHFFINANLTHNSFESQTIPQRFYDKVLADHTIGKVPPSIGGYMGRELRWAFLNFKNDGVLAKVSGNIYPDTICDFQIADSSYPAAYRQLYDTIDFYEESSFYLLKRKKPAKTLPVFEKHDIETSGQTREEYFRFFIIDADSLAGKFVRIDFDFELETEARPFTGWLIANALDADNRQSGYEYFPLEWLKTNWGAGNEPVSNSLILELPDDIKQLNFYLWNMHKVSFSITDGKAGVVVYK